MTKDALIQKTDSRVEETRVALQTLWDNINKGQQKQIIKRADVKELFDRYGVEYEE